MQFAEGIRLALQQIWTEKLKSFFSLLGVIVGVMFLIVVVSIVEGWIATSAKTSPLSCSA